MKVSFSFTVEPEHRQELLKLGVYVPETVVVEIEPGKIPAALRADVMSQLTFDADGALRQPRRQAQEIPFHPAHNLRALYLVLSREVYCMRRMKTPARVAVLVGASAPAPRYALPAQREHLSNAAHLIQVGPLQGRFSHAELCGLAEANSRPFAACVDVDKRHLLLLKCEAAPELAQENGYDQGGLLDKLSGLTMGEGETLFNTLKRYRCDSAGFAVNAHDLHGLMKELGR